MSMTDLDKIFALTDVHPTDLSTQLVRGYTSQFNIPCLQYVLTTTGGTSVTFSVVAKESDKHRGLKLHGLVGRISAQANGLSSDLADIEVFKEWLKKVTKLC